MDKRNPRICSVVFLLFLCECTLCTVCLCVDRAFCVMQAPNAVIILVGLKSDMRDKSYNYHNEELIGKEEIEEMKNGIFASKLFEVSALRQTGIRDLFDASIRLGLEWRLPKRKQRKNCVIL